MSIKRALYPLLAVALLTLPTACGSANTDTVQRLEQELPVTRWDHRPEADVWTTAALTALYDHGAPLLQTTPKDIERFCPAYDKSGAQGRAAFWAGFLSALAKYESGWNPQASGGGGRWLGLMQIDPRTARAYGCNAQSAAALKNGAANLSCAIRIAAVQVPRDQMVAGDGRKGVGRDWAPIRNAGKLASIAEWTRAQDYCQG